MSETRYRGRRAQALDNGLLQIIVTVEGGHIAAVIDKASNVNPLWSPPWPSIEPSQYNAVRHPEYGHDAESKLLAGILGHNLCLDLFGGPSEAEAAAGITVHGEASVASYEFFNREDTLVQTTTLFQSQLRFTRAIKLPANSRTAVCTETLDNLSAWDHPLAWTQHVTLGPPFLEKGRTQFQVSATRAKVIEQDFTAGRGRLKIGAEFDWPFAPCVDGSAEDLRLFTNRAVSGAFTTQLMNPAEQRAWFVAWSPTHRLAFGYSWRQQDFPWLGIWEENCSRTQPPWNGQTLTRGLEFGASPFPEPRRAMLERRSLFGVPAYKWLPGGSRLSAEYSLFLVPTDKMPLEPPAA